MKKIILLLTLLPVLLNAQIINTIAGTGTAGFSGDGGPATLAQLHGPGEVTQDAAGNLYISDYNNNLIRKINTAGIISTIAGTGTAGYAGDSGPATLARLNHPNGLAFDASGNMLFTDYDNHCIRKINTSGVISTVAGIGGASGYTGDGGPATDAKLSYPVSLYIDVAGNIYLTDGNNHCIRKINTSGIISTVVGNGTFGHTGDGGPATAAQLRDPFELTFDAAGNMYISDQDNNCIRMVTTSGIITTIAGNVTPGYSGDGGPASSALIYRPCGIKVDATGNLYFADRNNNCIRKINSSGIISTVAGTGTAGFSGDGGVPTAAMLNDPASIFLDASGSIYINDLENNRVRKIDYCNNSINTQPINDTLFVDDTAKFWVKTTMASPTYQWQEDAGSGFVNVNTLLPYHGANTDTLTIYSVVKLYNNSNYRCIISNGGPCTDTTSTALLKIFGGVGVTPLNAEAISIAPNPTHSGFTIRMPQMITNATIYIINQFGALSAERQISGSSSWIDLSELPAGIFILRFQTGGGLVYKKIVKY